MSSVTAGDGIDGNTVFMMHMENALTDSSSNNITVTNNNSMTWNYPALEGQLIMFRSYIEHYVPPHNSDKYRMALVYEL